jgi:hypothetical protein
MNKQGLIETSGRDLRLLNIDGLEDLAEQGKL